MHPVMRIALAEQLERERRTRRPSRRHWPLAR